VDTVKGIVYLNDSGSSAQADEVDKVVKDEDGNDVTIKVKRFPKGEPITIGAFMSAWSTDNYETIFVSKVE
jgi:hypothetical protein